MTLYKHIPVYRRIKGAVSLYHVFEIAGRGYAVQSRDFHYLDSTGVYLKQAEAQFLELLIEEAPEARSGLFATIEDAITAFDAEFDDEDMDKAEFSEL